METPDQSDPLLEGSESLLDLNNSPSENISPLDIFYSNLVEAIAAIIFMSGYGFAGYFFGRVIEDTFQKVFFEGIGLKQSLDTFKFVDGPTTIWFPILTSASCIALLFRWPSKEETTQETSKKDSPNRRSDYLD